MLLGRSQAVPDGREEETHPMGRFFIVFSSASGICHWQRQYRGQHFDPGLPVSLFLLLTDFLFIQNKSCQNIFLTHTRIQKISVSLLFG